MEEETKKPGTDSQGNKPLTSPSPAEKLTWWNGREIEFEDIMDL